MVVKIGSKNKLEFQIVGQHLGLFLAMTVCLLVSFLDNMYDLENCHSLQKFSNKNTTLSIDDISTQARNDISLLWKYQHWSAYKISVFYKNISILIISILRNLSRLILISAFYSNRVILIGSVCHFEMRMHSLIWCPY